MLIIEQSEADEEAALQIAAKTVAEVEEPNKIKIMKPKNLTRPPVPMADVKEEMKIIHDPTFGENRKRNRAQLVSSLVQEHFCPTEGKEWDSFIVKYNWNFPQSEYNPLLIKHMIAYG